MTLFLSCAWISSAPRRPSEETGTDTDTDTGTDTGFDTEDLVAVAVDNASFEEPVVGGTHEEFNTSFPGWGVQSGTVDVVGPLFGQPAAQGSQWLDLNGAGPGEIFQDITLDTEREHLLRFSLSANAGLVPPGVAQLTVTYAGNVVGTFDHNPTNPMEWVVHELVLPAVGPGGTGVRVGFASSAPLENGWGPALDAISLYEIP